MTDGDSQRFAPGALVAGKFRVIRKIGSGGMGAVYEVLHEYTKHRRALKVLHPNYSRLPAIVTRFLREASAAGRIGNPHIVETFDAGSLESGEPYIVMELLAGRSLDSLLAERGTLDFAEAISYVRQACRGLEAAHNTGIIHRDLKPDNLFIEAGPFVKILDFGISKFDATLIGNEQLTRAGAMLGTPFYMSSEQVRGVHAIDVRTDVYSLAAVLYECVTGNKPFSAATIEQLAVAIHVGHYEPVSHYRGDAPAGFAEVLAKGLACNRDERYPTVRAFADALAAFGQGDAGWLVRPAGEVQVATVVEPRLVSHAPGVTAPDGRGDGGGSVSEAPKRSKRLLLSAVAALVAVSVLIAVLWAHSRTGKRAPGLAPESLPSSSSAAQAERTADSDGPEVVSVVSPAEDPPVTAPVLDQTSPRSLPPAKASNDPQKPAHKTRATQHGLAEDNPFGR
jgi:serine/threonine-protein kinase